MNTRCRKDQPPCRNPSLSSLIYGTLGITPSAKNCFHYKYRQKVYPYPQVSKNPYFREFDPSSSCPMMRPVKSQIHPIFHCCWRSSHFWFPVYIHWQASVRNTSIRIISQMFCYTDRQKWASWTLNPHNQYRTCYIPAFHFWEAPPYSGHFHSGFHSIHPSGHLTLLHF